MNKGAEHGRLAVLLQEAEQRASQEIVLGLDRVQSLLGRLGCPEQGLAFVHVAGTNGKGSVIAFLEAMLVQAGLPPGIYTSPHLTRFNERIRCQGREIPDATLVALLEQTLHALSLDSATYFEITTCVALLYFAALRPPWVVLETGLGGRLDATNVVLPRLAVITRIGLDHTAYLGTTLERVAAEKAGIIKPGVPVVADPGPEEAVATVARRARAVEAPLFLYQRDYDYTLLRDGQWRYQEDGWALTLPSPALLGPHQYRNAALAIAAARRMGLPDGAIQAGIGLAAWPGRLECFPGVPPVWLDGAHNPDAAQALATAVRALGLGPVHLIFSALRDKDAAAMIALLAPVVCGVWTTPVSGGRSRTAEELARLWQVEGVPVIACAQVVEALTKARLAATPDGNVLVAGSLYLVGEARSLLL